MEVLRKNLPILHLVSSLRSYSAISYSKWQLDTCAVTHTAQAEPLVFHRTVQGSAMAELTFFDPSLSFFPCKGTYLRL
jgi:hypothetical protein